MRIGDEYNLPPLTSLVAVGYKSPRLMTISRGNQREISLNLDSYCFGSDNDKN